MSATAAPGAAPTCPVGPVRVHLGPGAYLRRAEVFAACQVLADAGRLLVAAGAGPEADALARLSVLVEGRLARTAPPRTAPPRPAPTRPAPPRPAPPRPAPPRPAPPRPAPPRPAPTRSAPTRSAPTRPAPTGPAGV